MTSTHSKKKKQKEKKSWRNSPEPHSYIVFKLLFSKTPGGVALKHVQQ